MKKYIIMFGVFLIMFYAGSSFLSTFGEEINAPDEIETAWNSSVSQINQSVSSIGSSISAIQSGGLNAVVGSFGLAFSGIYFIVVSLWSVFITMPVSIYSGISYIAANFGVPSEIVIIVTAIISILIVIKLIEFITGREI